MTAPAPPAEESGFAEWAARLGPSELTALLREEHPVYADRPPPEVARMRGWLLVLLARGELPAEALPFVLEELGTPSHPYLVAAAARALRSFQPDRAYLPHLRTAYDGIAGHDQPVDLGAYGGFDGEDPTTPVREIRRTEQWIEESAPDCCSSLPGPLSGLGRVSFLPGARRDSTPVRGLQLEDQAGRTVSYSELFHGQPSIVAFFYTRCDNPLKCSRTIWKLGRVQQILAERGLADRIRTVAITYDSEFDTPERLARFGANRKLRMDHQHRLARVTGGVRPLVEHFGLGVSFFRSLVSRHKIEVFVLDPRGRVAESFERMDWSESDAVAVAESLLRGCGWLPASGPAGALLAALIPKCPVCWTAYLSAAGFGAVSGPALAGWLAVIAGALLAVNLGSAFLRARATGAWSGLALSVAGVAAVAAGWALPGAVLLAAGSVAGVVAAGR